MAAPSVGRCCHFNLPNKTAEYDLKNSASMV